MKKFVYLILILSGCLLAFNSCKVEGEEIGDLYGRWKLTTISDNTSIIDTPDTVFLSFQAEVYQYQPNWHYDWGTYEKSETSLILNPLSYQSAFGFKALLHNDDYAWKHWQKPLSFQIKTLNNKNMILTRNDTILVFKKFID